MTEQMRKEEATTKANRGKIKARMRALVQEDDWADELLDSAGEVDATRLAEVVSDEFGDNPADGSEIPEVYFEVAAEVADWYERTVRKGAKGKMRKQKAGDELPGDFIAEDLIEELRSRGADRELGSVQTSLGLHEFYDGEAEAAPGYAAFIVSEDSYGHKSVDAYNTRAEGLDAWAELEAAEAEAYDDEDFGSDEDYDGEGLLSEDDLIAELRGEGADDELGSVQSGFELWELYTDRKDQYPGWEGYEAFIISENSDGFKDIEAYATNAEALAEWAGLEEEWMEHDDGEGFGLADKSQMRKIAPRLRGAVKVLAKRHKQPEKLALAALERLRFSKLSPALERQVAATALGYARAALAKGNGEWEEIPTSQLREALDLIEEAHDELNSGLSKLYEAFAMLNDDSATTYIAEQIDAVLGDGRMVPNYSGNLAELREDLEAELAGRPDEDEEAEGDEGLEAAARPRGLRKADEADPLIRQLAQALKSKDAERAGRLLRQWRREAAAAEEHGAIILIERAIQRGQWDRAKQEFDGWMATERQLRRKKLAKRSNRLRKDDLAGRGDEVRGWMRQNCMDAIFTEAVAALSAAAAREFLGGAPDESDAMMLQGWAAEVLAEYGGMTTADVPEVAVPHEDEGTAPAEKGGLYTAGARPRMRKAKVNLARSLRLMDKALSDFEGALEMFDREVAEGRTPDPSEWEEAYEAIRVRLHNIVTEWNNYDGLRSKATRPRMRKNVSRLGNNASLEEDQANARADAYYWEAFSDIEEWRLEQGLDYVPDEDLEASARSAGLRKAAYPNITVDLRAEYEDGDYVGAQDEVTAALTRANQKEAAREFDRQATRLAMRNGTLDDLVKLARKYVKVTKSAGAGEVRKAAPAGPSAEELAALLAQKVSEANRPLAERLEALERQPMPGGPVLRPVSKTLPTVPVPSAGPDERLEAISKKEQEVMELRRLARTEPNPALRPEYARQLEAAEKELNKLQQQAQ